jgi:hypothetical protein
MDRNKPEPTLEESIKQVMRTLPPVIRNYLGQGKYTTVAKNVMTKYGLRIDQGGVLEREIMLLLMGIENPDEFTQVLITEANLNQQTVNSIIQDVNDQIFMPLREEMRKSGAGNVQQQTKTATPSAAPQPIVPSQPAGVVGPPPQSPSYFHLDNKLPIASGLPKGSIVHPPPPKNIPPRPLGSSASNPEGRSSLRSVLAAVTAPAPALPKGAAADTGHMLEDHEEPHIEFKKAPANLPGAMPPPVATKPPVPRTPVAPYATDPYREPIE